MDADNTTSVPSLSIEASSVLAGFFFIIFIFGVILNTILVVIICIDKNLHTITNVFIINLAISDLITAVSVVPFDADSLIRGHYPYGIIPCGIKETMFMLSLPSSVVNLLLLTFERFMSSLVSFKKVRYFTKTRVAILITLSWVYTVNAALFPIYWVVRLVLGVFFKLKNLQSK